MLEIKHSYAQVLNLLLYENEASKNEALNYLLFEQKFVSAVEHRQLMKLSDMQTYWMLQNCKTLLPKEEPVAICVISINCVMREIMRVQR